MKTKTKRSWTPKRAVQWVRYLRDELKLQDWKITLVFSDHIPDFVPTSELSASIAGYTNLEYRLTKHAKIWVAPSAVKGWEREALCHEVLHVLFRDAGITFTDPYADESSHQVVYVLGATLAKFYDRGK